MGYNATGEFDGALDIFLEYVPDDKKFAAVEKWYGQFLGSDWDTQEESSYYDEYLRHIMVKEHGVSRWTAVLYINRSDSRCGYCDQGAFPSENGHYSVGGYSPAGKEPCGMEWEVVSSEYANMAEAMIKDTYGYDNLIGLPVVRYGGEYLGAYGGKTRANAAMPEVPDEEDFTVYESEDLR